MNKRFRLMIFLMAAVFSLSACTADNSNKEAEVQSTQYDDKSSAVSAEYADEKETQGAADFSEKESYSDGNEYEYEYERPLNIIDDNYRNYYEIFVYSYYDSDSDGIGDLNGVIKKLDFIQDMGFNGIWLMPIMQSDTYHKYDVVDYRTIDSEYGTLEDFERLVSECHKRNIRVVIDMVINHTSSKNEWFTSACDYLRGLKDGKEPDLQECPYVDYYHFSKEKVNSDYYSVSGSNWYYEGVFWSEMPDLNLESESVRAELADIADFWLDMGVDGFRMDAALHYEENNPSFNTEVMNWLYEYCRSINPDFYMVSEVWSNKAAIAQYYQSRTPSMFNFDVADAEGKIIKTARGTYKAERFVESMAGYAEEYGEVYEDYIDAPFITNHDMGRAANSLMKDENDMKMACGLLMTMNGSPFVYYGEEIGMSGLGKKDENKRLPYVWSKTDTAGMTKGPKDADKDIVSAFDGADAQLEDPSSILNYYKRAIRLRNENPEIARGEISIIDELTMDNQAVITKTYNQSTIAIVYNTSDQSIDVDLEKGGLSQMKLRGYVTVGAEAVGQNGSIVTMPAQSICILK